MTIQRSDYGCGDNSCIFGSPGGMGTNGGCRCLSEMPRHALTDRLRVQRGIIALREKIAEEAKVRAGLVEALRDAKQRIVFDNEDDFDGSDYEPEAFEAVGLVESIDAALAAAEEIE